MFAMLDQAVFFTQESSAEDVIAMASQERVPEQIGKGCPSLLLPSETEGYEYGVFEEICQHLGTVDRVRLLSTCKELWKDAQLRSSPALWGSVDVKLHSAPEAEAFASWLLTKRDCLLSLSMRERLREGDTWEQECKEVFKFVEAALLRLAGGPLQQLRLDLGSVEVRTSVLTGLPNLRSLILVLFPDQPMQLQKDFSQLTALTQLAVGLGGYQSLQLQQGSLPAGLKRLSLHSGRPTLGVEFDLALSGVESLQELHLTAAGLQLLLTSSRLGSLTRLTLRPTDLDLHLQGFLPAEVAALTNLQHLDLHYSSLQQPGGLQWLSTLTKLTYLSFAMSLEHLPVELQALPHLKALTFSLNRKLPPPLPDWAVWGQLEALSLPLHVVLGIPQQLMRLTSLTFLELTGGPSELMRAQQVQQVLAAAGDLPRLQGLNLYMFMCSKEQTNLLLQEVRRRKPRLLEYKGKPLRNAYDNSEDSFERVVFHGL